MANNFDFTNAKIRKSLLNARGGRHYLVAVLYMAPAEEAATRGTVCPHAGACRSACLAYSGNRAWGPGKRRARARRKREWMSNPRAFTDAISREIERLQGLAVKWSQNPTAQLMKPVWDKLRQERGWPAHRIKSKTGHMHDALRLGMLTDEQAHALRERARLPAGKNYTPVIRLNGTSDIPWERTGIMQRFPKLQFYDYTKNPARMLKFLDGDMPKNYYLTFSMGGTADAKIPEIIRRGGNVTVVFDVRRSKDLPGRFGGRVRYRTPKGDLADLDLPVAPVIDGDHDDLRFLDEHEKKREKIRGGCYIGLRFKSVTDAVAAGVLASEHDLLEGFVYDPTPYMENPGAPYAATGAPFRFGCGGLNMVAAGE